MAMSKSRGTLPAPDRRNPRKCFDVPPIDNDKVEYTRVPVNTDPIAALSAEEYVKRSVSDLGVDTKDGTDMALLSQYIEGSIITCTFYTQLSSDSYGRSTYNTFSESVDPIHQNYRKIINFQMKLKDEVNFSYSAENTQSSVQGEAVLFPYFCPQQGDMFIYQATSDKLGLFKITAPPERHTIQFGTCHSIKFILITWVTDEILSKLNACVSDVAYFNLSYFLGSKGSFLSSDESEMINEVSKAIHVLTHRYVADFLEQKIYRTFIENACLYDPYIVEFCLRLFDCQDLPIYPVQLKPHPKHWTESFWHMLLDPDYTPEEIVVKMAMKLNYGVTYRTTGVTALTNRCFIELEKGCFGVKPYPPFVIPTKFDPAEITVPMQVRLYLSDRMVFPTALLALAKEMLSVRRISAFYFIPIVIFLLKKLLKALETGNKSIIYQEPEPEKQTGCICDCSDCIFNCNPPHLKYMPRCPGHAHHQCSFRGDCNSIYIPPCGGCNTDARPYPSIYSPSSEKEAMDIPEDIRLSEIRKLGFDIGNVPMPKQPEYGPKPPIHCIHPVVHLPNPPFPPPHPHPHPSPYEDPYNPPEPPPRPRPPVPPPRPTPPSPQPYPPKPPKPMPTVTLVFDRPENEERLSLVVERSLSPDFEVPLGFIDTRIIPNKAIPQSDVIAVLSAFDGENYTPIFREGVGPTIRLIVAVASKPREYSYYRYQWFLPDGTGLGWIVY